MLQQEGYEFMGAAFEVYNEIGYGMAEEIYQQSLIGYRIAIGFTSYGSAP